MEIRKSLLKKRLQTFHKIPLSAIYNLVILSLNLAFLRILETKTHLERSMKSHYKFKTEGTDIFL